MRFFGKQSDAHARAAEEHTSPEDEKDGDALEAVASARRPDIQGEESQCQRELD
jgi:hypothetical protein